MCVPISKETIEYTTRDNSNPQLIAIGDFNKDGHMDIVTVNIRTDSIGILLGNGNSTFASVISILTGYDSLVRSLAIGDFNQDNNLDIVVTNEMIYSIGIFLGYGDGTFADQLVYKIGLNSHHHHSRVPCNRNLNCRF